MEIDEEILADDSSDDSEDDEDDATEVKAQVMSTRIDLRTRLS
jgi:hypothetical protein